MGSEKLLVSLHDLSPLTLTAWRRGLRILELEGLSASSLTCLIIPNHEGRAPIDQDGPTREFIGELAAGGAQLVLHGLTHQMDGRVERPMLARYLAHNFAGGCGEFYRLNYSDTCQRLEEAAVIMRRAGFEQSLTGFIPPAWLLSREAESAIAAAGFLFYERWGGIVRNGRVLAPRLVGGFETRSHRIWSLLQSLREPRHTRLAIHPGEFDAPALRWLLLTLRVLRARLQTARYDQLLAAPN
jgi:predicted deacetylase